jgi:acetyltransferase-like isoleucine patch superfamily enzyme
VQLLSNIWRVIRKAFLVGLRNVDPVWHARAIGVVLGEGCRLINVDFGSEPWLVRLGDRVSASDCHFVTHDGGVWVLRPGAPGIDVIAPIVVGSNVFIGLRAIILPGAMIGSNVVVGAGSVVTGEVEDNCVVAGVPARRICDLEEYSRKSLEKSVPTKSLAPRAKRASLVRRFFGRAVKIAASRFCRSQAQGGRLGGNQGFRTRII